MKLGPWREHFNMPTIHARAAADLRKALADPQDPDIPAAATAAAGNPFFEKLVDLLRHADPDEIARIVTFIISLLP